MLVANNNTLNKILRILNTSKNEIISYKAIFNTTTPLNTPPNLKKGNISYKIYEIGFLKINAKIKTTINPTKETNSLVNPLLNPISAPKAKIINIIKSTTFKLYQSSLTKLYYNFRKK